MKTALLFLALVYASNVMANPVGLYECDTDKPVAVKKAMAKKIKGMIKARKGKAKVVKPFVPCETFIDSVIVPVILDDVAVTVPKYLQNFNWVSQAKPRNVFFDNPTRVVEGVPAQLFYPSFGGFVLYPDGVIRNIQIPCRDCVVVPPAEPPSSVPVPSSLWLLLSGLILLKIQKVSLHENGKFEIRKGLIPT